MAISKCAHCQSTRFECKENEPKGSKFKVLFIQCASCGVVVGMVDYYNIPLLLKKLAKALGVEQGFLR